MAMCAPIMCNSFGLWGIAVYEMTVQQASWPAAPTFGLWVTTGPEAVILRRESQRGSRP